MSQQKSLYVCRIEFDQNHSVVWIFIYPQINWYFGLLFVGHTDGPGYWNIVEEMKDFYIVINFTNNRIYTFLQKELLDILMKEQ